MSEIKTYGVAELTGRNGRNRQDDDSGWWLVLAAFLGLFW